MTTGLRFFFRHIHVTGLENIPSKGPAIIIANHHSSLMDAALLGILVKRKAWFFARGDVFANKFVQKILWWLHMMPVHGYRGKTTLQANQNSFSDGRQVLLKGGIVVFFPESTSHTARQLLPFRKGVFRLAFDALAASDVTFDIPIIPVGITYDHPVACRKDVQVHTGKPLLLSDYKKEYKINPAATLLRICKDAHRAVGELVLHIADHDRLHTAEACISFDRNDHPVVSSAWKIASAEKLRREQMICKQVNSADEPDAERRKQQTAQYFDALSAAGLADKSIVPPVSFPAWKKILLWIGFPVYIIGLLLNGLPVLAARLIADKKVYREDFYSWIFVACYSFIYFFWLVALMAVSFFFGWKYAIVLFALMVTTGIFAYVYKDWLKENRQQNKIRLLSASRLTEFRAMRSAFSYREATLAEVLV